MNRAEPDAIMQRKGPDSLTPSSTPATRVAWLFPRRAALGLGAQAAPSLPFVLAGLVLGPEITNVISVNALAYLDPIISVALAILGIFIGAGCVDSRGAEGMRWLIGASLQALVTLSTVTAVMYFLFSQWLLPVPAAPLAAASVLGICTAVSAAAHIESDASRELAIAAHLADLDDAAVLILATVAVPIIAGADSPVVAVGLALVTGLCIAAAGGLLFVRSQDAPKQGVFVIGTVILLGGAAAYVNVSPIATGCVAGLLWTGREAAGSLAEFDLRKLQHPLVALLLVIAGASIQFSLPLLWIAAPLILFRLAGKLLASLILARWLRLTAGLLCTVLVPPGVLGIALALNFQQVLGTGDTLLVSAVTVAAVVSEILGGVLSDREGVD